MSLNLFERGRLSIVIIQSLVIFFIMSTPLYATGNVQNMDMAHDYIMDKQKEYNCSMVQMDDAELSNVTAAGFSTFTFQNGILDAYLNIQAQTWTEIQSLKMGYYNDGTTLGWDNDWTNVSIGSSSQDLVCKGLFIEAGFSNPTDPVNRTLNYLRLGTPSMTGPISATFNSFSGDIEDGTGVPVIVGGVSIDGHRITTLGTRTVYSNSDEFYVQLSSSGAQAGWWFYWKNATVQ